MWKNIDKDSQTLPTHQLVSPKSKKLSQNPHVFYTNLLRFFRKSVKFSTQNNQNGAKGVKKKEEMEEKEAFIVQNRVKTANFAMCYKKILL